MKNLFNLLFAMCIVQLAIAQNTNHGIDAGNSGIFNTSIGYRAGNIVTGASNTFLGHNAGIFTTSGSFNTFLGTSAGRANTTGKANTFIGLTAGLSNTIGEGNIFLGYQAGRTNTTGNFNTVLGYNAGYSNLNGGNNTFIGKDAGYKNQAGSGNVFIGLQAGYSELGSNKLYIDNSSTSNPLIYGDFATNELTINGVLQSNYLRVAPQNTTDEGGEIFLYGANNYSPWYLDSYRNDFRIRANNGVKFLVNTLGNVGIGTSNPAARLDVAGKAQVDYLHVDPQNTTGEGGEIFLSGSGGNQGWHVDNFNGKFRLFGNGQVPFVVTPQGHIGIGTDTPNSFKLAVDGKIGAREMVITNVNPWPDYVFADDYKLRPLEEVAAYIQKNKHLPQVPSAKTVAKEGIKVGEMNATLLRKIEELTLYMIEQNKVNAAQSKTIEMLKKQVESLKKAKN